MVVKGLKRAVASSEQRAPVSLSSLGGLDNRLPIAVAVVVPATVSLLLLPPTFADVTDEVPLTPPPPPTPDSCSPIMGKRGRVGASLDFLSSEIWVSLFRVASQHVFCSEVNSASCGR